MEDSTSMVLTRNWESLVEQIDTSDVIDSLISHGVISPILAEDINCKMTRSSKTRAMLDAILRRGPDAFTVFCDSLRECYPHLVLKLEHDLKAASTKGQRVAIEMEEGEEEFHQSTSHTHGGDHNGHKPMSPVFHDYHLQDVSMTSRYPMLETEGHLLSMPSATVSSRQFEDTDMSFSKSLRRHPEQVHKRLHSSNDVEASAEIYAAYHAQSLALDYLKSKNRESLGRVDMAVTKGPPQMGASYQEEALIEEKNKEIEGLKRSSVEKDRMVSEIRDLMKSYEVESAAKSRELDTLRKSCDELKKKEGSMHGKIAILEAENEKLKNNVLDLERKLKLSKETMDRLVDERTHLRKEGETTANKYKVLTLKCKQLEDELAKKDHKLKGFDDDIDIAKRLATRADGDVSGVTAEDLMHVLRLVKQRVDEAEELRHTVEQQGRFIKELLQTARQKGVNLQPVVSNDPCPAFNKPTQCTDPMVSHVNLVEEQSIPLSSLSDPDTNPNPWTSDMMSEETTTLVTGQPGQPESALLPTSTASASVTEYGQVTSDITPNDGDNSVMREAARSGARPKASLTAEKQLIGIAAPMRRMSAATTTPKEQEALSSPRQRPSSNAHDMGPSLLLEDGGHPSFQPPNYHVVTGPTYNIKNNERQRLLSSEDKNNPSRPLNFERNIAGFKTDTVKPSNIGEQPMAVSQPATALSSYTKEPGITQLNLYHEAIKSPKTQEHRATSPSFTRGNRPLESGDEPTVESQVCPLCSLEFTPPLPERQFEEHVNDCLGSERQSSGERICPVCEGSFPSHITQRDFEMHVQNHFEVEMSEVPTFVD